MLEGFYPTRYAIINEKNKREIVMLRGSGCTWRKCRFCDYHLDCDTDPELNFALNETQLDQVTGIYHKLEVINSGSFPDLDAKTMQRIGEVCQDKRITELHFECHWSLRGEIAALRQRFQKLGIQIKVKIGVETFDRLFRESYLVKGIDTDQPAEIAAYFDECCLLQGIPGQTAEMMRSDIEIGLKYFQRVCVNLMQKNKRPIKPDPRVLYIFMTELYPIYEMEERVDILLENTAFGVGGTTTNEQ